MELSKLARASAFLDELVTEPFTVGDESVDVTVNIAAFTSEFWRRMSALIKQRFAGGLNAPKGKLAGRRRKGKKADKALKDALENLPNPFEFQALEDETERAIFADLLLTPGIEGQSPVLADWGMTVEGEKIKPSREVLMGLPTPAVRALWLFCRRLADTVKKQQTRPTSPSPTTGETIGAGSSTSSRRSTSTPVGRHTSESTR